MLGQFGAPARGAKVWEGKNQTAQSEQPPEHGSRAGSLCRVLSHPILEKIRHNNQGNGVCQPGRCGHWQIHHRYILCSWTHKEVTFHCWSTTCSEYRLQCSSAHPQWSPIKLYIMSYRFWMAHNCKQICRNTHTANTTVMEFLSLLVNELTRCSSHYTALPVDIIILGKCCNSVPLNVCVFVYIYVTAHHVQKSNNISYHSNLVWTRYYWINILWIIRGNTLLSTDLCMV